MANIDVEDGKFVVSFEGLDTDGRKTYFQSVFAASGEPIALRQPDQRSFSQRFEERYAKRRNPKAHQGIYRSHSFGNYLAFIDKLESEEEIFLNWRCRTAESYRRVAIGKPIFLRYGPMPHPHISTLLFEGGRFFLAWITDQKPKPDLMLSSIDPESAACHHRVVQSNIGYATLVSLANIGSHGLIVCYRAILDNKDSKIIVYPVALNGQGSEPIVD